MADIQTSLIQAVQFHQAGRLDEAEALYRAILAAVPCQADAWHFLGAAARQRGHREAAITLIRRAIRLEEKRAVYHSNLAVILKESGRLEETLAAYEAALRCKPDSAAAQSNRAIALKDLGHVPEAGAGFDLALALAPDYPDAYCHRGTVQADYGFLDEALACFDLAIRLKPAYAEALSNRAAALTSLGLADRALYSAEMAICLQPDYADAYANRAAALTGLGRIEESLTAFEPGLHIDPVDAAAHNNRSLVRLTLGDFDGGWREHEWRKRSAAHKSRPKEFSQPVWTGEDLAGRTILLHAEQGFGDVLQFCRYAPLVAERGGRVVLQAPRPLLSLLESLAGVDRLVGDDETLPPFDLHCPLMSLPLLFGTRLDSIPAVIPYLRPSEAARSRWAARLGDGEGLKVGLVWAGNPRHSNDRSRSLPFAALTPLWDLPGIRWYSLQLGERRSDLSGPIEDLSPHLGDFQETAAALSQLDLLLTVDTSAAHLAGACGYQAWVMLPRSPDWRWLLERSDSPWYPSLRLFRQAERGDWDDVIAAIAEALASR